jgi:PmbA protein
MIEKLQKLLTGIPELSAWRIRDRRIQGEELYFIRRSVDMQRSKDVRRTYLTIYRDFQDNGNRYRGSVDVQIHPTYSDQEIRALVDQSLDSARYVRNQHYPLVEPGSGAVEMPRSRFADRPLQEWLAPLAETIYAQEDQAAARINSAELFLNSVDTRIVNSLGLDVSYRSYSGYLELIVEDDGKAEDNGKAEDGRVPGGVELYRSLSFSDFEPELLAAEIRDQLRYCSDRSVAGSTPHLKHFPVLLTGDPVPDFFEYYLTQSAADSVYSGICTVKVGESIQGEGVTGDPLTLSLEPFQKNSPSSAPVDEDGFALDSTRIIDAGRLERYWGPLRFCHYLNVPATGTIGNVAIKPGSKSLEELRQGPHLEVVYFSDFVTEALTGDFGGEIRLAYYTDLNGKRRPMTGGSVSGNIRDVQGRMHFSRETQSLAGFQGPVSILLPAISVSGAAST